MAYTKKYLLLRIIEIQNIVLEYKRRGHSQVWVYHNIILKERRMHMSKSTFDNYMSRNARKELKELELKELKQNGKK